MENNQHWRGSWTIIGLEASPVLVFGTGVP
jgi:hypothetical protein